MGKIIYKIIIFCVIFIAGFIAGDIFNKWIKKRFDEDDASDKDEMWFSDDDVLEPDSNRDDVVSFTLSELMNDDTEICIEDAEDEETDIYSSYINDLLKNSAT